MAYLDTSAEQKLLSHSWPGNVRELDNVIQRALILRSGSTIDEHAIFIENLTPTQFVVEATTVPEPIKSNLSNAYYDEKTMPEDEQKNDLLALDTGSYKDELKDKEHTIERQVHNTLRIWINHFATRIVFGRLGDIDLVVHPINDIEVVRTEIIPIKQRLRFRIVDVDVVELTRAAL